ncbi:hypothetical protein [Clostridium sp.]|uniref:Lin0368 family putative glycerol transporter subunit n=1 Tax=Clostridium sp. TaxID=1506 RepID=UPI0026380589|nr:hypothetical protein [Clostridium sp.]
MWGRLVNRFGGAGGFLAAFIIVGTIWIINHGMKYHFIQQGESGWIDMAWAAAIGVFTATVVTGGKVKKSFYNIGAAVVGGIISGIIVALLM